MHQAWQACDLRLGESFEKRLIFRLAGFVVGGVILAGSTVGIRTVLLGIVAPSLYSAWQSVLAPLCHLLDDRANTHFIVIKKNHQIDIGASGVRNIWLGQKMQTMALRIQKAALLKK